jgi:hypothetical protein
MKTKYILLIVILIFASPVFAQNKAKNFVGFSFGASVPMGAFSKADAGTFNTWNNTAGFAKTGLNMGVEGAYYFLPKLGLAGTINFSNHGGFSKTDASTLGASYTDAFGVAYTTVSTHGQYNSVSILVGPQFSFPMNKLTIDVRVLGGLLKSISTPTMTVQLEDQVDPTFKQLSSKASAFGWQAGGGLRYALTGTLGLLFRADYFSSIGLNVDNENRNNRVGRWVTKQPMSWVSASIGVSFSLGK